MNGVVPGKLIDPEFEDIDTGPAKLTNPGEIIFYCQDDFGPLPWGTHELPKWGRFLSFTFLRIHLRVNGARRGEGWSRATGKTPAKPRARGAGWCRGERPESRCRHARYRQACRLVFPLESRVRTDSWDHAGNPAVVEFNVAKEPGGKLAHCGCPRGPWVRATLWIHGAVRLRGSLPCASATQWSAVAARPHRPHRFGWLGYGDRRWRRWRPTSRNRGCCRSPCPRSLVPRCRSVYLVGGHPASRQRRATTIALRLCANGVLVARCHCGCSPLVPRPPCPGAAGGLGGSFVGVCCQLDLRDELTDSSCFARPAALKWPRRSCALCNSPAWGPLVVLGDRCDKRVDSA